MKAHGMIGLETSWFRLKHLEVEARTTRARQKKGAARERRLNRRFVEKKSLEPHQDDLFFGAPKPEAP